MVVRQAAVSECGPPRGRRRDLSTAGPCRWCAAAVLAHPADAWATRRVGRRGRSERLTALNALPSDWYGAGTRARSPPGPHRRRDPRGPRYLRHRLCARGRRTITTIIQDLFEQHLLLMDPAEEAHEDVPLDIGSEVRPTASTEHALTVRCRGLPSEFFAEPLLVTTSAVSHRMVGAPHRENPTRLLRQHYSPLSCRPLGSTQPVPRAAGSHASAALPKMKSRALGPVAASHETGRRDLQRLRKITWPLHRAKPARQEASSVGLAEEWLTICDRAGWTGVRDAIRSSQPDLKLCRTAWTRSTVVEHGAAAGVGVTTTSPPAACRQQRTA